VRETFAPFLPSQIPEIQFSEIHLSGTQVMPPQVIPEVEASPPRLWELLEGLLWDWTPGLKIVMEKFENGEQRERGVIDRGQPKEMLQLQREIAEGTGRNAAIWKKLKSDYKFKGVALRRVSAGALIGWLGQHPHVLAEILQKNIPGLDAAAVDGLARTVAHEPPQITETIIRGVPVTSAWVDHIVSVIDQAPSPEPNILDVLDELAACVLFEFRLHRCKHGHHWCFADEHFRGDCADHQAAAQKRRARMPRSKIEEVLR
jgi:hypothetical protein